MTQNSNITEFSNEYKGGSFSFSYDKEPLSLYLQADSNNNIFKAKFETKNNQLKSSLDKLCQYSIDKNLDDLIVNMAKDFDSDHMVEDYSLIQFKEALYAYSGEVKNLQLIDSENLICRCAKLDSNAIETNFIKENGDTKEVLKKTNASMLCGQCSHQVTSLFNKYSLKHKLFLGKDYKEWEESILEALEQFAFYSPQEFQGAEFEVIKLEMPKIYLNIKVPHKDLKSDFAQKSLMNYLSKELQVGFEVNVSIDSFLSN